MKDGTTKYMNDGVCVCVQPPRVTDITVARRDAQKPTCWTVAWQPGKPGDYFKGEIHAYRICAFGCVDASASVDTTVPFFMEDVDVQHMDDSSGRAEMSVEMDVSFGHSLPGVTGFVVSASSISDGGVLSTATETPFIPFLVATESNDRCLLV
jgi:hypothetical protein